MSYKKRIAELYRDGKVDEITMIKMAAFEEELEKIASKGDLLRYLGIGAGITGAAIGGEYLMDKNFSAGQQKDARAVFDSLYSQHPEFKKYPKETVEAYFTSLYHHSPRIATDPVSAKSYLLNMLMWEGSSTGVPVNQFSDLAQISSKNPLGQNYFTKDKPLQSSLGVGKAVANILDT